MYLLIHQNLLFYGLLPQLLVLPCRIDQPPYHVMSTVRNRGHRKQLVCRFCRFRKGHQPASTPRGADSRRTLSGEFFLWNQPLFGVVCCGKTVVRADSGGYCAVLIVGDGFQRIACDQFFGTSVSVDTKQDHWVGGKEKFQKQPPGQSRTTYPCQKPNTHGTLCKTYTKSRTS